MREVGLGSAVVTPNMCTAGAWGELVVTYQVGTTPLASGSVLRTQLPDSWHAWFQNAAKGVQAVDPAADNYVSARTTAAAELGCSVEGGSTDPLVKTTRTGLDGAVSRYVYVCRVEVLSGDLRTGDQVELHVGDTSGGSRGLAAALHPQGGEHVLVEVQPAEGGPTLLDPEVSPLLTVHPDTPAELIAVLPSTLTVGDEARLRVVVLDQWGNRVDWYDGTTHATLQGTGVQIPDGPVDMRAGRADIPIAATGVGTARVDVILDNLLRARSNPAWVTEQPQPRILWGDLHSHADRSHDAIGRHPYEYARDVSMLDFYALTEHCERWSPGDWAWLTNQVDSNYEPGRFVTFLAYEATFPEPWGHHNVFFRQPASDVVIGAHNGTVLDLWRGLEAKQAFTIPHHTGISFSAMPAIDWSHHDPELRRTVEIFSGHGQSELYEPDNELSYESSDFSMNASCDGPHYARDAWERGLELGVIASSDNHRAQPGRGELGLAAVYADKLDREAVFDALHDRCSYGTTGARILLWFEIDGVGMGGSVQRRGPLRCRARIAATSKLRDVELIRGVAGAAGSTQVVTAWHPAETDTDLSWTIDPAGAARSFYYLRVREDRIYRGRRPTAWSSPVWVTS